MLKSAASLRRDSDNPWRPTMRSDAGVAHLAALPRLREISLDGRPGVTWNVIRLFPEDVRVNYSG